MLRPLRPILALVPLLWTLSAPAQENAPRDSVVKELSAQSNELIDKGGVTYRKVTGPARFLHNNTYLLCDTAMWNVKCLSSIGSNSSSLKTGSLETKSTEA